MAEAPEPKLTLADIAESLGVSTATVSRVLNGHHHVHEDTRRRILDFVRDSGYRRIPVGPLQSFIGVVKRYSGTNYYGARLLAATSAALEARGFYPALIDPRSIVHGPDIFEQTRVAAVLKGVAWITSVPTETAKSMFQTHDLPVVFVNQNYTAEGFVSVVADNTAAARKAVKYLAGRGHRRIAFLGGQLNIPMHRDRLHGFLAGLDDVGIAPTDEWIITDISVDFLARGGEEGIHRLLAQQSAPSAIVLMNDFLAPGAYRGARSLGYRVPEDLSFIAFGDSPYNEFLSPALTTFRQPVSQMVESAVTRLLSQIADPGNGSAPLLDTYQMTMIVRESVTVPPD